MSVLQLSAQNPGQPGVGAQRPRGDLAPGLRAEGEAQAPVDQPAQLRAEPEILAKDSGFHGGSEGRAERLGLVGVTQHPGRGPPAHPSLRPLRGHRSLRLGLGGTGERLSQPSSPLCLGLRLPCFLRHVVCVCGWGGCRREEMCPHAPPTPVRCFVIFCFSPRAWASGFGHKASSGGLDGA